MSSRHERHLAHLRHIGPTSPGTTNVTKLGAASVPLDYKGEQFSWTQDFPAGEGNDAYSQLAPEYKSNTDAIRNNFQFGQNGIYNQFNPQAGGLSGALGKMYQGQQALQNGPGNAFSRAQLQNMHAMSLNQLQSANRGAMQGLAGANAGRGVAGNNIGGVMGQSLGVLNAGALAQGDLAEQQAGLNLGLNQYNARSGVAGNLLNALNAQDQRNAGFQSEQFRANMDERQNAYQRLQQATDAKQKFLQQYAVQLTTTSGAKNGDQTKTYLRAMYDNIKRNEAIALQQYNRYNNQNNPNQQLQMGSY